MSDRTKEQLQGYVDAAKLDILELLSREKLNVFEFRRLIDICEVMIPLCNSAAGGMLMPDVITHALWESEDNLAPTLHGALGGHVFDVDTLLQEKYKAMARTHSDLRAKIAMTKLAERDYESGRRILAAQIENVGFEEAALAAERQLLEARTKQLDRRELALTSGESASKQLSQGGETIEATVEPEEGAQQGDAS